MRIIKEAYTKEEVKQRVADTRNIIEALKDSLSILQSALSDIGDTDLARSARLIFIDVDDISTDFSDSFSEYLNDSEDEEEVDIDIDDEMGVEESLSESSRTEYDVSELEKVVRSTLSKYGFDFEHGYSLDFAEKNSGSIPYIEVECADGLDWKDFSRIEKIFSKLSKNELGGFAITVNPGKEHVNGELLSIIFDPRGMKYYFANEGLNEDTVKTSDGKWTNKGDTGETHGKFNTKKEADAQRKAIFASGWKK